MSKNTIFHQVENYLNDIYDFRRNVITLDIEFKNKDSNEWEIVNDSSLYIHLVKEGYNISQSKLTAILMSEFVPDFNPFNDYFDSLPVWDEKTDHIKELASFIHTPDSERFYIQFKKWLVRTVACSIQDNYFNKHAIILVSPKQNSGKSTFCRFLCPGILNKYISESIGTDRDGLVNLTRYILINLDELATLEKKDINSLKSLFSKDFINVRLPYGSKYMMLPRRASFIGSTNDGEFLADVTGSVRWLCFEVSYIDFNYKQKINIDDVYSQAYFLYKHSPIKDFELSPDEIKQNEEQNEQFRIMPYEFEFLAKSFIPGTESDHDKKLTPREILDFFQIRFCANPNRMNEKRLGALLRAKNFIRVTDYRKNTGYSVYCYLVKDVSENVDSDYSFTRNDAPY